MLLTAAKLHLTQRYVASVRENDSFQPLAPDADLANRSRAVLLAMHAEGPVWVGQINLYGAQRKQRSGILRRWHMGQDWPITAKFALASHQPEIVELIHQRDISAYVSTADDATKVDRIFAAIYQAGGTLLHWGE